MTTQRRPNTRRPSARWKVLAGIAIAAVTATLANAVIAATARTLGAPGTFPGLQLPAYASLTVIGILAGAAGWHIICRTAKDPHRTLRWLIPTVVTVSLLPDLALLFSDQPDITGITVLALIAMHLVVAATAVLTYQRVLPPPRPHRRANATP